MCVCELALKMGLMCFCISVSILIKFPHAVQLSVTLLCLFNPNSIRRRNETLRREFSEKVIFKLLSHFRPGRSWPETLVNTFIAFYSVFEQNWTIILKLSLMQMYLGFSKCC